jgi:hypothetical protein
MSMGPVLCGLRRTRAGELPGKVKPMSNDQEPKIFIDEDWKAQVQREKEEAAKKAAEAPVEVPAPSAAPAPGAPDHEKVSFSTIVSVFSMQAMLALGLFPEQQQGEKVMVDLVGAKHLIDMMLVLRDKTKGNLSPEEQGLLTQTISEMQQAFVVRS